MILVVLFKVSLFHLFSFLLSRVNPSEPADQGCHGDEQQTDSEDSPCDTEGETPLTQAEQHIQQSQKDTQVCWRHRNTHLHKLKHTSSMFLTHTKCESKRTHTIHRLWPVVVWASSIFPIANLLPVSVCQFIPRLNVWYYQHSPSLFCSDCDNSWNSTREANRDNNNRPVLQIYTDQWIHWYIQAGFCSY